MKFFGRPRTIGVLVWGLLFAAVLSGGADAITDNQFKYSKIKHGHLNVSAMGFAPADKASAASNYTNNWGNELTLSAGTGCFNTSARLPHRATITSITVYGRSSSGNNPFVQFIRFNLVGGNSITLAELGNFGDTTNTYKAIDLPVDSTEGLVDNSRYMYGVGVCVDSSSGFYGVKISYTYLTAGD